MPSTVKNKYTTNSLTYYFAVGFGYLSIVSIVLYEGFNLYAAFEGVKTLDNLTVKLGSAAENSIGWVLSEISVGLEAGASIGILAPAYEARRFLGIEDSESQLDEPLMAEELGPDDPVPPQSSLLNFTLFGLMSLGLIVANSAVIGVATIIPIHNAFGLNSTTIPLLIPLSFLSFVYQFLFVCADTSESCVELFKGSRSVYALLWQYSKLQFFRSFVESFVMTNIYFCVMSSYVVMKVFGEICGLNFLVLPLEIIAAIANVYTLLPRHEELFRGYMQPFKNEHGAYDLNRITDKNRNAAWLSLNPTQRRLFILRASIYGLLVWGVTFYFADKYSMLELSQDHHRTALNTLISFGIGLVSFSFILFTDWHYNMNRIASDFEGVVASEKQYSLVVKGVSAAFNFGAQFTRGICMVTFFVSVLGASFDAVDLLMMALLTSVIVGGTNWVFYDSKLRRRLHSWEKSAVSFFSNKDQSVNPYYALPYNACEEVENHNSRDLMNGWRKGYEPPRKL